MAAPMKYTMAQAIVEKVLFIEQLRQTHDKWVQSVGGQPQAANAGRDQVGRYRIVHEAFERWIALNEQALDKLLDAEAKRRLKEDK